MTNSTDSKPAPKPKKAKGPIRTGLVVPSLIFVALVYGYFYFFFDHHLRRALEYTATNIVGAEVDIGSVQTSFWGASFRMRDLEVTDKTQPSQNLVAVGEMHFQLLMDALLRAKAVVKDASILDIRAYSPRAHPGRVLPPPKPGILAKAEAQVTEQVKQKLNKNFLGDIVDVLGGTDPKQELKDIQANLKSVARADGLQKELAAKKIEWEAKIKALPKPQEVKDLQAQVKALNFKGNPIEIAQNLKKAKDIIEQAKGKESQVEQGQKDLTNDINTYASAVKNLETLAEADVNDLQKQLKLPSLDPKEFSTQLFLSQVESRLGSLRKYIEVARKYMPPKKTKEQIAAERSENLVPPPRGTGRTYTFPITTGYPLFWLQKAAVSSEIAQSDWAGTVKGELNDISTDPSLTGRPFRARLHGDFPKRGVQGFDLDAALDHTTDTPKESLKIKVSAFPLQNLLFSDTPKVRFGLKQAVAASAMDATLTGDKINFVVNSSFQKPDFLLETPNAQAQAILAAVLKGIPTVTFGATVTGTWDSLQFAVDSNLGPSLSAGFKKELDAKLGDAKAKLRARVESKLDGPRKQAQAELQGLLSGPAKLMGQNLGDMTQSVKDAQNSAQPSGGAKGLLKGFGL